MFKIGIITYHNNENLGGILQAYCLWKSLTQHISDSFVEIIDYRTINEEIRRLFTLNPYMLGKHIIEYNTCINFLKDNRSLSPYRIITNNHKKAINFINKNKYNMIVVGSDQIWNIQKFFCSKQPFPNAYFLDPKLKTIKVSYAPSANKMIPESLTEDEWKIYKKHISAFDKISVRDTHTENLLKSLGISKITKVPDPTIINDMTQIDLKNRLHSFGISSNKPIVAINQLRGGIEKTITEYYRSKGYQIVAPNYSKYSDLNFLGKVTPFEYYSLHKYFDFVITGSFHTTIFSIKNFTPFVTIDHSQKSMIDKKETLLKDISLPDRHIKMTELNKDQFIDKIERCEKQLDENKTKKSLYKLKQKGIVFIKELEDLLIEKNE